MANPRHVIVELMTPTGEIAVYLARLDEDQTTVPALYRVLEGPYDCPADAQDDIDEDEEQRRG